MQWTGRARFIFQYMVPCPVFPHHPHGMEGVGPPVRCIHYIHYIICTIYTLYILHYIHYTYTIHTPLHLFIHYHKPPTPQGEGGNHKSRPSNWWRGLRNTPSSTHGWSCWSWNCQRPGMRLVGVSSSEKPEILMGYINGNNDEITMK